MWGIGGGDRVTFGAAALGDGRRNSDAVVGAWATTDPLNLEGNVAAKAATALFMWHRRCASDPTPPSRCFLIIHLSSVHCRTKTIHSSSCYGGHPVH
jgi:hypothetical protein